MIRLLVLLLFTFNLFAQSTDVKKTSPDDSSIKKERLNLVTGIKKEITLDFDIGPSSLIFDNAKIEIQQVPKLRQLILSAKSVGSSNIIVKDSFGKTRIEYDVTVTETSQSKTVQELRELIGDIEGIEIDIRAGKVIIDGEIIVPKDIGRLVVALEPYKEVVVFVEPSPHTLTLVAKRMQDEIQKQGMKDVTVRVVNGKFWLEGVVNDKNNKKFKAQNIATAFLPDKIDSLAQRTGAAASPAGNKIIRNFIEENEKAQDKPLPKLIKVSAQFVELSKDYARTFGFRWAPQFAGGGGSITIGQNNANELTTSSSNTLSATISNLIPKLAAARNAGNARVIQSGMVVTEDDVQTSINKTSTIPFAVGTGEFTRAQNAQATFSLGVKPTILKQEKIKLGALNFSVSIITGTSTDGNPLTTQNRINTNLIVDSGESAVVGGIFQSNSTTAYDKLPNTDENADFLFNFVRSKNYNLSKSQFVVFVTPEVIDSASKNIDEIRRKFRRRSR